MSQQTLSLIAVALAIAWIGWKLFRWARLRRNRHQKAGKGCDGGCGCGHG